MINYIKEKYKNKFYKKLKEYILHEIDYRGNIKRVSGKEFEFNTCYLNQRCHWIALNTYAKNKTHKVIPCLYEYNNDGRLYAHFINYDEENEVYVDNTVGVSCKLYYYYIFNSNWLDNYNRINEENLKNGINMNSILNVLQKDFEKLILDKMSWFARFILKNENLV